MTDEVTPQGKEVPDGGWNGRFYETPTTAGHRMYNAGYEKMKAQLHIAIKALEKIDERYEQISYHECGELQIIAQQALAELETMKFK